MIKKELLHYKAKFTTGNEIQDPAKRLCKKEE